MARESTSACSKWLMSRTIKRLLCARFNGLLANLNVHGQRSESHKGYQRAAQAALRLGFRYVADEFEEADARADALSGNCQTVRRLGRPALALAICGETARAEKLAAETSRRLPNGTIWNAVQLPEIEAMIALQSGQAVRSVELLASASPYERSYLDAVYVRGHFGEQSWLRSPV